MKTPAVRLEALTRTFGGVTAVDSLTLEVQDGELFGIVGPDGAGKTTLLRMLAGVLPPTRGTAHVLGHDVAREPERVKHDIAYMAQRFGLYEDLTVRENVMFYADLYRVPQTERSQRLERLYAFSRLGEFQHRLAGKLSGGMKQKLSLCCALIHHPRVLLLDEPTFGVDPISRRDLWLILHEMVAEGVAIVVTTSYLDEAERCDRVAMLNGGKLLALDAPLALEGMLHGAMFSLAGGSVRAARDAAREIASVKAATLFGETLHVLAEADTQASALRGEFEKRGVHVAALEPIAPSLEDVFINLVSRQDVHAG